MKSIPNSTLYYTLFTKIHLVFILTSLIVRGNFTIPSGIKPYPFANENSVSHSKI